MKKEVGLWIDHKNAIIISISKNREDAKKISSNIDNKIQRSGTARKDGLNDRPRSPDDILQRSFTGHLNTYYDEIISCIRGADSIHIFGPGEAKGELKKRLEGKNIVGLIQTIETADNMTGPQIAAKVRQHLSKSLPRRYPKP